MVVVRVAQTLLSFNLDILPFTVMRGFECITHSHKYSNRVIELRCALGLAGFVPHHHQIIVKKSYCLCPHSAKIYEALILCLDTSTYIKPD